MHQIRVQMPSLGSAAGQQSTKSPPVAKLAAKHDVDAGGMNDDEPPVADVAAGVWASPRTTRERSDAA
jgi:hypothetical protein